MKGVWIVNVLIGVYVVFVLRKPWYRLAKRTSNDATCASNPTPRVGSPTTYRLVDLQYDIPPVEPVLGTKHELTYDRNYDQRLEYAVKVLIIAIIIIVLVYINM